MQLAFIGLGAMGRPMAENLARAGHDLVVYNRSRGKAEGLASDTVRVADSPAAAVAGADVLVTMLSDDDAVSAVLQGDEGALAALPDDAIHLSMSTLSAAGARRFAGLHDARGQHYVAAPVFGRPDAAAAAKLRIVVAGSAPEIQRCEPLLQALGQQHFVVGEDPGLANVAKLLGNFMIMAAIEAMGEAFALGGKAGLDAAQLLEIYSTLFASPIYRNYGALVAERRYSPPGFRLVHGLKDARLVLQSAQEVQAPLPLASLVHDRLLAALANGHGELDWAALAEESNRAAGRAAAPGGD